MKNSYSHTHGFTLIELMVSLGIFSIIMLLASVAYLSLIFASNQVRSSTSAMDDLSMAVSSMARDIRTGECTTLACPGTAKNSLTFINTAGCIVTYSLVSVNTGKLSTGVIQKKVDPSGPCLVSDTSDITDPGSIDITGLTFNKKIYEVTNIKSGTKARQLLTTIIVKGTDLNVNNKSIPRTFSIETGATMRKISIMP